MTTVTTRRAALAGAAVLPAMSLPAIAGADPVFEKIAKYRAAWGALSGHTNEPVDANGKLASKTPEYKVWEDTEDELCGLLQDAEDNLISTQPRTQAGAAAAVKAYLDVNAGHFKISESREGLFLENLLAYLESDA